MFGILWRAHLSHVCHCVLLPPAVQALPGCPSDVPLQLLAHCRAEKGWEDYKEEAWRVFQWGWRVLLPNFIAFVLIWALTQELLWRLCRPCRAEYFN